MGSSLRKLENKPERHLTHGRATVCGMPPLVVLYTEKREPLRAQLEKNVLGTSGGRAPRSAAREALPAANDHGAFLRDEASCNLNVCSNFYNVWKIVGKL